jgi:TPP-dependent pyruvate/acetoin dehydrogenase alpha subunit
MAGSPTSRVRSGQSQAGSVEAFSDADEARATGLVQILDEHGRVHAPVPALSGAEFVRMYEGMLRSRLLDEHLLTMQRQGRIGLYLDARGQEAGVIAAAHALAPDDYFVPALREMSAALYRGLPLRACLAQMLGNANDLAHGRQMPGSVGSRATRHVIGSSSVASQMPHATGLAWAARMRGEHAVDRARAGDGPSFVEAVTYRLGAHGPTDDPSRYRDPAEAAAWQFKDPLLRFGAWLDAQKILTAEARTAARQRIDEEIRAAIAVEEAAGPPSSASLFDDVLAEPSWLIKEQRAEYLRARKRRNSQ